MAVTILGTHPQIQGVNYSINRIDATTYEIRWIGTLSDINTILASEASYAEGFTIVAEGSVYTLIGRYVNAGNGSSAGTPIVTLELETGSLQQSIFLNPTFQELTEEEVYKIREVFDSRPATRGAAQTAMNVAGGVTSANLALAMKAYDLMSAGAESFELHSYIITRTQTADRRYSTALTTNTIDLLWSSAQLSTYVGSPHLFAVPSLTLTAKETAKNLFAGWRQMVCRVIDHSNGSRQMVEQWQLAKWSQDLYALKP